MADDVLINKAATIERCVGRAREEYFIDPATFATNFSRQDAAILNIQRLRGGARHGAAPDSARPFGRAAKCA